MGKTSSLSNIPAIVAPSLSEAAPHSGRITAKHNAATAAAALPAVFAGLSFTGLSFAPNAPSRNQAIASGAFRLHASWDRVSRDRLSAAPEAKFREDLTEAYLAMVDVKSECPDGVEAHLWTELPTPHALLRPVARFVPAYESLGQKSRVTEVEIPHSMLQQSPVEVHLKGAMDGMMDWAAGEDRGYRVALNTLYRHPITENIGGRADLTRALYTALYYKTDDDPTQALNIHIDPDTAAGTVTKKHRANKVALGWKGRLENEKSRLRAMKAKLDQLAIPRKIAPISVEDVGKLAKIPQRNFWTHSASLSNKSENFGIDKKTEKNLEDLQMFGFSTRDLENDLLVVSPLHDEAWEVLDKSMIMTDIPSADMHDLLKNQADVEHLRALNGDSRPIETLTSMDLFAYFSLAERIRKVGYAAIGDRMEVLAQQKNAIADSERLNTEMWHIVDTCSSLISEVVNDTTFSPQGPTWTDEDEKKMEAAVKGFTAEFLFGTVPPVERTKS